MSGSVGNSVPFPVDHIEVWNTSFDWDNDGVGEVNHIHIRLNGAYLADDPGRYVTAYGQPNTILAPPILAYIDGVLVTPLAAQWGPFSLPNDGIRLIFDPAEAPNPGSSIAILVPDGYFYEADGTPAEGGYSANFAVADWFALFGADPSTTFSSISYTLQTLGTNLTLTGLDGVAGTGNPADNRILGNPGANSLAGAGGNDTIQGDAGADTMLGGSGDDSLVGQAGADSLAGAGGADTMEGGPGDDSYLVDNSLDEVSEAGGDGVDTVFTTQSQALRPGFENLTLLGVGGLTGTGNGLGNVITGNGGANALSGGAGDDLLIGLLSGDTLIGGAGADTTIGGIGADRHVVDSALDVTVELDGEGNDTVVAPSDWTLDPNVEWLSLTGLGSVAGTGNARANRLAGNAGDNLLRGLDGNDNLIGGDGADTLAGGSGLDRLVGGADQDWFLIEAPLNGADAITDLAPSLDRIAISVAGFGAGLAPGALDASMFVAHESNVPTSTGGTPQFVYNTARGVLFFDADGSGGAAAWRLATLSGAPPLAAADLVLV